MTSPRRLCTALIAVSLAAAVTSCSSSSGGPAAAGSLARSLASAVGSARAATSVGSATAPASPVGKMRMRIVNLYDPNGKAGPALDVYDVQLSGQKATPLVTNVAFGSASAYFTPHVPAVSVGQPSVQIYALPAGEDRVADQADARGIGGAQDDGSHPQITWLLTADTSAIGDGPLAALSFADRVEKGDLQGTKAPVAPPTPAGEGEILVDSTAFAAVNSELYLLIDDSCTAPINGDLTNPKLPYLQNGNINGMPTSFSIFPVMPGTHQVSVVAWTQSDTPTCAQLTAKQGTTAITVTAGQQVETYVYGTSLTALRLSTAPLTS